MITKEEASFNSGGGVVVESNDSNPYTISLSQGWNQIGNPYNFNLLWQDILDANDSLNRSLLGPLRLYDRQFEPGSILE